MIIVRADNFASDPKAKITHDVVEERGVDFIEDYMFQTDKNLVSKMEIVDGMRVLDVGCGLGRDIEQIATTFPNCECVGIDLEPGLIARCPQLDNASFQVMDMRDLSGFPDDYFDIVFSNVSLAELTTEEADAVLLEMQRIGKDVYCVEQDKTNITNMEVRRYA